MRNLHHLEPGQVSPSEGNQSDVQYKLYPCKTVHELADGWIDRQKDGWKEWNGYIGGWLD